VLDGIPKGKPHNKNISWEGKGTGETKNIGMAFRETFCK
jgi:hypothetical protein